MNLLIYLLFLSIFFVEFLNEDLSIIPRKFTWIPELLSFLTYFVIFAKISKNRKLNIDKKYLVIFLSLLSTIAISAVINGLSPFSIIIGLRYYFKTLPFFLIAAVHDFTHQNFRQQLSLLIPIILLQMPVAVVQRFTLYRSLQTGDVVSGTVLISSALSILMICSLSILNAMYLKKEVKVKYVICLGLIMLLPTMINETKGTLLLLPIAFFVPVYLSLKANEAKRVKQITASLIVVTVAVGTFFIAYDYLYSSPDKIEKGGLSDFLSNPHRLTHYLYAGEKARGYDGERKIRRIDSILIATEELSKDAFQLFLGRGIGSMIKSFFKSKGDLANDSSNLGAQMLGIVNIFWEQGLIGVFLFILFLIYIYRDSIFLLSSKSYLQTFALGWCGVVVIIGCTLFYKNMLNFNSINYLFWYFSGLITSHAYQLREERKLLAIRR